MINYSYNEQYWSDSREPQKTDWYKPVSAFDENPVPVVIMPNTDEFYQHSEDKGDQS